MTRGGGVAAPDPALAAKRALLYLQALQRVRQAPDANVSARTLARLQKGSGLVHGVGLAGMGAQQARALDDTSVTALMSGLDALRKKIGGGSVNGIAPIYSQSF